MTRKPGRKCLLILPDAIEDWGKDPPRHWTLRAERIKAVAIVPRFELSTATARDVLTSWLNNHKRVCIAG